MAKFTLELSDGLAELAMILRDFTHEPRILDPQDAAALVASIELMHGSARALETQLSRHMWNEPALRERLAEQQKIAEISRPGSNVTLFPVVPRPRLGAQDSAS